MSVRQSSRVRLWTLAVLTAALVAPATRADNIDKALLEKSRDVIKYLKEHNAKTVGVLKFRAQKGDGGESLNVGPINSKMAERLEMTLVMTLPLRNIEPPIKVLHDASGFVASKKLGLDYLTPADRSKLFGMQYPEVVGQGQLTADLFLTGTVKIDTKARKTQVTIKAFDKATKGFDDVTKFEVDTDRSTLSDVGMGFALAKRNGSLPDPDAQAADSAASPDLNKTGPGKSPENPVILKVFLDGQEIEQDFDMKDSLTKLRLLQALRPGAALHFTLQNRLNDRPYAAVLKVNGSSVLFDETEQDLNCRKFILKPNAEPLKIAGVYDNESGQGSVTPFAITVNNPAEGEKLGNSEVGLIRLAVFTQGGSEEIPASSESETRSRSAKFFSKNPPKTYGDLARSLNTRRVDKRNFIIKDANAAKQDGDKLVVESFDNPSQVFEMQIRYLQD